MLTRLHLERFKNFQDATLCIGPLTVLVGTNASGKSNLRDAFRFLHGIAREYRLAEILGEKWIEGGVLQWRGIRGGALEATYLKAATFILEVDFALSIHNASPADARYAMEVEPNMNGRGSRIVAESLYMGDTMLFDSRSPQTPQDDPLHIKVGIKPGGRHRRGHVESFIADRPVLPQIVERLQGRTDDSAAQVRGTIQEILALLRSMRFLDLSPEAMRLPSLPGQTILGDRGENLSSVLQAIADEPRLRRALIEWVAALTPIDVVDFEFTVDQTGRVLITLVEANEQRTSVYSASDGTLRFLAMLAALLAPESAHFYFIEELENGIHPTRLPLLISVIEDQVINGAIQIVGTSHSPQLLRFLDAQSMQSASLVYRLASQADAHILPILDIPEARRVVETQDVGRLYESGWLEDAVTFMADPGLSA